jgi:hypothetical protein
MSASPGRPAAPRLLTAGQRESLTLLALAAMTVDHVGRVLFPDTLFLRVVGRLSFPLIAVLLAQGALQTRSLPRYLARLLAAAVVSQAAFAYAFRPPWEHPLAGAMLALEAPWLSPVLGWTPVTLPALNVLFGLSLSLAALWSLRAGRWRWLGPLALLSALLPIEYGLYGLCTVLLIHVVDTGALGRGVGLAAFAALSAAAAWLTGFWPQALAPLGLALALWPPAEGVGFRLPRLVYYAYYPLHLLALGALRRATGLGE